jgi:hypothetical protein
MWMRFDGADCPKTVAGTIAGNAGSAPAAAADLRKDLRVQG